MKTIADIATITIGTIAVMFALFITIWTVAFVIAAIEEILHPIKGACKRYKSGGYRP